MIRSISSSFLDSGTSNNIPPISVQDEAVIPAPAYTSVRTPGAAVIQPAVVSITPKLGEDWLIQSVAIQAYLSHTGNSTGGFYYGQFGRILGGFLSPQQGGPLDTTVGVSNSFPYKSPVSSLPPNPTLIFELWNPSVDALPPRVPTIQGTSFPQWLPITGILQLTQPIDIGNGDVPYIGMWMEPTVMGSTDPSGVTYFMSVVQASYTIIYDDRQ